MSQDEIIAHAQDVLSSIPKINSGGCGVAALALLRYARKNGVDTSTWIFHWWDSDWCDYNKNCGRRARGLALNAPAHVVVCIGEVCLDSNGESTPFWDIEEVIDDITEDELVLSLNGAEHPYWNKLFDRIEWVPVIESELNIDLSDVELF